VIVSEDDIDKVRPASTRVIDLIQFDETASLDPMYVDRTYYLAPDGQVPADAFAVMREGMKGKIGVGKLALYGREYLVAVKPHDRGLVMYTLHHAAEIRSMNGIDELAAVPTKVKPEEVQLARQVIGTFARKLDLADYRDEYREGLQKIIDAKIAGQEIVAPAIEAPPKVVNLMDALRKSLDTASGGKKKVAKAELPKKAAKTADSRKKRTG
jgi:DNA end-binding protein Ku